MLRARLERALWQLPVGYRTVIVLHDVEGLEHEEVAQILGCHVGTSKSQLHKARGKLREILLQDGITSSELEETLTRHETTRRRKRRATAAGPLARLSVTSSTSCRRISTAT